MQQLKVTIGGRTFSVATDEHADIITQAAQLVEARILEYGGHHGSLDEQARVAIFVAFLFASEAVQQKQSLVERDSKAKTLTEMLDAILR